MIELLENIDLRGYTFILPSVSVGNVGQLTADLLINTLQLKKLGYVWHTSIVAIAGGDPFGNDDGISTACEIFYSENLKIVVLQLRSGLTKAKNEFLKCLSDWVKKVEIKKVVILTGSFAHERRDNQLTGEPLRYIFCPLLKVEEEKDLISRKWIQLENKVDENEHNVPTHIPGSDTAMKLYETCVQEKIPCAVLIEFCSDGNNAPDALKLADYLDSWLHLKEKANKEVWNYPPSWILLFGPQPPSEIFN